MQDEHDAVRSIDRFKRYSRGRYSCGFVGERSARRVHNQMAGARPERGGAPKRRPPAHTRLQPDIET